MSEVHASPEYAQGWRDAVAHLKAQVLAQDESVQEISTLIQEVLTSPEAVRLANDRHSAERFAIAQVLTSIEAANDYANNWLNGESK